MDLDSPANAWRPTQCADNEPNAKRYECSDGTNKDVAFSSVPRNEVTVADHAFRALFHRPADLCGGRFDFHRAAWWDCLFRTAGGPISGRRAANDCRSRGLPGRVARSD